jgi:hypothetical protein
MIFSDNVHGKTFLAKESYGTTYVRVLNSKMRIAKVPTVKVSIVKVLTSLIVDPVKVLTLLDIVLAPPDSPPQALGSSQRAIAHPG